MPRSGKKRTDVHISLYSSTRLSYGRKCNCGCRGNTSSLFSFFSQLECISLLICVSFNLSKSFHSSYRLCLTRYTLYVYVRGTHRFCVREHYGPRTNKSNICRPKANRSIFSEGRRAGRIPCNYEVRFVKVEDHCGFESSMEMKGDWLAVASQSIPRRAFLVSCSFFSISCNFDSLLFPQCYNTFLHF